MTYDAIDSRYHLANGRYSAEQDFWYQVNNGPVRPFTISRTAEDHQTYYGETSSSDATPGWEQGNEMGMTIHENTNNTNDYAYIMVYGDADVENDDWDFTLNFDENIDTSNIIGRDDTGDTYQSDRFVYGGLDFNTDGVIVDMAEWSDVTFTVDDRDNTFQSFHLVDDPDGSQNYENATVSGSIRMINRS